MYIHTNCRDGLGFPIIPLIGVGASAIGGLFRKGPKGPKILRSDARAFVRAQYLELFCREPDPGAKGYEDCLVEGKCTAEKVRSDLMASPEYSDKRARGVCRDLPPPSPQGRANGPYVPSADEAGAMMGGGGGLNVDTILNYWPYIAGGAVLLMVLKR